MADITNYERIKNMSIDEMELFFRALAECDYCGCYDCVCFSRKESTCVIGYTREWLNSEVDDG